MSMPEKKITVFYVPFGAKQDALDIAGLLLEQKLIVCVNIYTSESAYIWQGKYQNETEYVAVFKTVKHHALSVQHIIESRHPYDIPVIGSYEMVVNDKYYAWALQQLQ